MERNTMTTVDKLRIGDRFYRASDKNKTMWTKVEAPVKKTFFQTYRHHARKDGDKYAIDVRSDLQVVFMRHTIPLPGEEWLLNELRVGDVFFMPNDIITEYKVLQLRTPKHDTVIVPLNGELQPFEHCDIAVTFIRKEEEVKA